MVHHVKDLSPDQKLAIESILGRSLSEDESLTIRPAKVTKDAPAGEERVRRFRQYTADLDQIAGRVKDVPEDEIDAAIDEAAHYVRNHPE
jgi:hypothetical protein